MRVLVCTPHMPYPPRGGGRADIWRRVEALTRLGHSVMLIHQHEADGPRAPRPEDFEQMDEVLSDRFSFTINRGRLRTVRQLLGLWRLPWAVAKTVPSGEDLTGIQRAVAGFAPEMILLEGPWFGELGRRFAAEHDAPIVYRSHNVEHVYRKHQAQASPSLRNRVALRLTTVGLKKYELTMMRRSRLVLDISLDDLEFWREHGVSHISWLPPLPELALSEPPTERLQGEVVFVGGLRFPNNVHGVRWLVDDVLPILQSRHPDIVLTVVGSTPDDALRTDLAANPAVRTFFDVDSVNPYLFGAKVLVNPVSIGSGVQLKMLDMLMTDAPIITRSTGARGLPPRCVTQFQIADTKEAFASAIVTQLETPTVDAAERGQVRELFTVASVQRALDELSLPPVDEEHSTTR